MPSQSFVFTSVALDEASLVSELLAGRPVLRETTGHIDVVTGCSADGYIVTDSMYEATFTCSYSDLVQSPYNSAAKWVASWTVSASK